MIVEIPDGILRRAKSAAGTRGISLQQLFAEALQEKLNNKPPRSRGRSWLKLAGAFGKTRADRAETRRLQKLIDQEFKQLKPEDRK